MDGVTIDLKTACFAQLLWYFRLDRLISSSELARLAGVSKAEISSLESGRRTRPGMRVMRGIITALKLNTEERQLLLNAAMYIYVKPAAPQPVQQEPEEITDHVSPGDLAKIEPARDPVPATEEEFLNKYRQAV